MLLAITTVTVCGVVIVGTALLFPKPETRRCWCCHQLTYLSRQQVKEGWHCSHCTGYNGFDEHGDYNKPIGRNQEPMRCFVVNPIDASSFLPDCQKRFCGKCQQLMEVQLENSRTSEQTPHTPLLCEACQGRVAGILEQQTRQLLPAERRVMIERKLRLFEVIHYLSACALVLLFAILLLHSWDLLEPHLGDSIFFKKIMHSTTHILLICCISSFITSLFLPKQGVLFPILILTIHLCMSRYRDIIFDGIVEARDGERIMCAACLLMSLVKLLNTIRRLPIAVQHEASMRGVEPLGTLKKHEVQNITQQQQNGIPQVQLPQHQESPQFKERSIRLVRSSTTSVVLRSLKHIFIMVVCFFVLFTYAYKPLQEFIQGE